MNQSFITVSKSCIDVCKEYIVLCSQVIELGDLIEPGQHELFLKTASEAIESCNKYIKQAYDYVHQEHAVEKQHSLLVQDSIKLCKKYIKACKDTIPLHSKSK